MNTNAEKIKNTKVEDKDIKKYGFIRVTNMGGFVAYAQVSYMFNGEFIIKNTRNLPVLQGDTLTIPVGATDITFNVNIAVYYEEWTNIYHKTFNSIPTKCYKLYGITSYAECIEVPCDSNDNGSTLNPPIVIVPCSCCSCKCYNYWCNPYYYSP